VERKKRTVIAEHVKGRPQWGFRSGKGKYISHKNKGGDRKGRKKLAVETCEDHNNEW